MDMVPSLKSLIERVVNVYETGKPGGDYGAISRYADGPHGIRQITYGRSQTTEYGRLRELLAAYVAAKGRWSADMDVYLDRVGADALVNDSVFLALLRKAGRQDPVMQETQDRFFDEAYFRPAMTWAAENGFTQPLSALVIYDSFIHSGSILWCIRKQFATSPPAAGGDEKTWIRQYVEARQAWLAGHSNPVLRRTIFRTRDMLREIKKGNWDLSQLPFLANGVAVS